ncbi:MAG: hypothetical protein MUF54_01580 [Polyangiaceae bacterium]|nr:hypothetical protein [Polyangiaceae bacterium]
MTRKREYRLPTPKLTDAELQAYTRPTELPAQPWRYTITPELVTSLTRIAEAAGEMRAVPISYYRRKELEARARRLRILWVVGWRYVSVKPEEVEAVLNGARLVERREPIAEAIRRAAIVEDALAHFATEIHGDPRLTPELATAYERAGLAMPGFNTGRWMEFNTRERARVLDLHRGSIEVPPAVRALFEWADADPLVSTSTVLRAATIFWGLTLLCPTWRGVSVVLHHELRVGRVDPHGLLMLTEASEAQRELLTTPARTMAAADEGNLTTYFERFAYALARVLSERLRELGRVQDTESYLPWKVIAPPDALDAHVYEAVERLGQAGSAAIVEALGRNAAPLRTVQRRLQKLVSDGVLSKRGARKNAIYKLAGRDGTD